MSAPHDDLNDMRPALLDPFDLDAAMADALLDGRVHADDVPPAYQAVATVLRAADAPLRPDEVERGPEAIRRIFEEARRPPTPVATPGAAGSRRLSDRWSLRAAVVAIVAMFTLGGGAAMAATGNLPAPLQSAAHDVLGAVGVEVPDAPVDDPGPPAGGPPETQPSPPSSVAPVETPTSPVPADEPPASVPADDPMAPADVEPSIEQTGPTVVAPPSTDVAVAPVVPTTDPTGVPGRGDEICPEASDGRCRAARPKPSDPPAPPTTQTSPSETAPGQVKKGGGAPIPPEAGPKGTNG
jgi:hypothetical protein